MQKYNPYRFIVAKQRRGIKGSDLAKITGLNPKTISRLKTDTDPGKDTIEIIAKALRYPVEFFYMPNIEVLSEHAVSFRSLSKMTALNRDAAIAAGSLGILFWEWVDNRFDLPKPDVPDLRFCNPEEAAIALRQHWKIGQKPIRDIVKLIESKGVRVLSLCIDTKQIDAYSFFKNEMPYVFLNNFKTAEHSVFDTAHELGHLILHQHSELTLSKQVEAQANEFAAAFLMPRSDLSAKAPRRITAGSIIKMKKRWNVSAMALTHRLKQIGRVSDWQYRSLCIDLSKRGYRTSEPDGIERQKSVVVQRVLEALWKERITKKEIASDLNIPVDELENLLFKLTHENTRPERGKTEGLGVVSSSGEITA